MGGKAILLVVIGFGMIFAIMGVNFGRVSTSSVKNFVQYYSNTKAHNMAVSGANMAANAMFLDPTWTAGYSNVSFDGGTLNVTVQILDSFKNIRQITSTSSYNGYSSLVRVVLQPSQFSKFGYYSIYENGIWFVTGDTISGPTHTQDYLNVYGHPVFNGKVTTLKGINKYDNSSSPVLNGGYQQGVSLPIPSTSVSTLETQANTGGHTFKNQDTVYLTFANDSLQYKFSYKGAQTTVKTSVFAPNGTIFADNAVLRIQGTVKGQLTIGASSSQRNNTRKGTIYIDGNVVYNSDPRTNPSSTDLLGIVAQNNVYVTDNAANTNNVYIDASIFSQNGGFGAENYNTRPPSGTIYLVGGITQKNRSAVGTFGGDGEIASGFYKNYQYDNRFMIVSPPFFPNTGGFEIVSWYE
ncbi:MAG: hypothetical protein ACYCVH_03115 [Ignavibacteriaceae bacterium]